MSSIEERTPVIVGAAQRSLRDVDPGDVPEPLNLLEEVARKSAHDAGIKESDLIDIDCVGLVDVIGWRPRNGPRLLAERLGARPSLELLTTVNGYSPLLLANRIAAEIAAGRSRFGLVAGCNTLRAMKYAHREGRKLGWTQGGEGAPEVLGDFTAGSSALEQRYGMVMPSDVYPMLENAMRARRGLAQDVHLRRIGALFAKFSQVAEKNPHAWFPVARSAEELTQVTQANRMIAHPYPKYLNAVLDTDQAAGALLMSAAEARRRGIPEERQVHFWGGAHAQECAWFPSQRPDLADCPSLRLSATSALARAGVELEDVGFFDFYSCFPVAVEMACDMLGIDAEDPRGLTVTGGLPYAGGPGANYCLHSLATLFEKLRARPGQKGLVTGVGWYLTRNSATLLASMPRPGGPPDGAALGAAPERDEPALRPRTVVEQANGPARIVSYTVLYDREGAPRRGIVIGQLEGGDRFVANSPDDRGAMQELVTGEAVGRVGSVSFRDGMNCFEAG